MAQNGIVADEGMDNGVALASVGEMFAQKLLENGSIKEPGVPGDSDDGYEFMAESNNYLPWIHLQLDWAAGDFSNLVKFMRQAHLEDLQQAIVREFMKIAHIQETADCANRRGRILMLREMQSILLTFEEDGVVPDDEALGDDALKVEVAAMLAELESIHICYSDPELAKVMGYEIDPDIEGEGETEEEKRQDAQRKHVSKYVRAKIAEVQAEIQLENELIAEERGRGVTVDFTFMKDIYSRYAREGKPINGTVVNSLMENMSSGRRLAYEFIASKTEADDDQMKQALMSKNLVTRLGEKVMGRGSANNQKRQRRSRYSYDDDLMETYG